MKDRVSKAREGFREKDVELTKEAHTKKAIHDHKEEHNHEHGQHIGDFVYGALDGIITTFAVVSGVAGANLSIGIVLILGFANLFADGFSMALGSYLSTKSEKEYEEKERERELWETENIPEGEREEIRQIYKKKGFKEPLLEQVVNVITSDKKVWVDTMMIEELHLFPEKKSPIKSGVVTFVSFVLIGFLPLLPYVVARVFSSETNLFLWSIIVTAITLFIVGACRSIIIGRAWWRAGSEMLLIGAVAAFVAYGVGVLLRGLA